MHKFYPPFLVKRPTAQKKARNAGPGRPSLGRRPALSRSFFSLLRKNGDPLSPFHLYEKRSGHAAPFPFYFFSGPRGSTSSTVRVSPATVKRTSSPAKDNPYTRPGSRW